MTSMENDSTEGRFSCGKRQSDLHRPLAFVVAIKIRTFGAAHQQQGELVFIEDLSDLVGIGGGRRAAPVGVVFGAAVAAFEVDPFGHENFFDANWDHLVQSIFPALCKQAVQQMV